MSEEKIKKWLEHYPFSIFLSGGKDSVATLLWVLDNVKNKVFNVIYAEVSGNTHEWCNYYVHYVIMKLGLEDRFLHLKNEKYDFFECLVRWGVPLLQKYRWCREIFKIRVWHPHAFKIHVLGLRRLESKRRMWYLKKPIKYSTREDAWKVNPLWSWTTDQVIDYIREHGLRLNPCYRRYGHGGNCMFCPYRDESAIILTLKNQYWREKILSALKRFQPKGPIGKEVKEKWLRLAMQTTLVG